MIRVHQGSAFLRIRRFETDSVEVKKDGDKSLTGDTCKTSHSKSGATLSMHYRTGP